MIVSFSQFRPEKDQSAQLKAFYELLQEHRDVSPVFYMIGSCRNKDDEKLLARLKGEARDYGIDKFVKFKINLPQPDVIDIMASAKVAIHTMRNEHFGISIVEMMAAGLITIAHRSGGPLSDIIKDDNQRGYLCKTPKEFAEAMYFALSGYDNTKHRKLRSVARQAAQREFSDEAFMSNFESNFRKVL